ncbi:MAG: hypothetical protein JW932_13640 [Deltaproteobacteria bacterium]|nr:hypothetical protein [Deltaproteobacteria bacterium]
MAEIKSTLDLIMEKTKGMTMTDEEKRAFKEKETTEKVKGLIQRYLDGFMDLERLRMEITAFEDNQREFVRHTIIEDLISMIGLGKDNRLLWEVLEKICSIRTVSLKEELDRVEQELSRKRSIYEKEMMNDFNSRGISGSAVMPNIDSYPVWLAFQSGKETEFKERTLKILL